MNDITIHNTLSRWFENQMLVNVVIYHNSMRVSRVTGTLRKKLDNGNWQVYNEVDGDHSYFKTGDVTHITDTGDVFIAIGSEHNRLHKELPHASNLITALAIIISDEDLDGQSLIDLHLTPGGYWVARWQKENGYDLTEVIVARAFSNS